MSEDLNSAARYMLYCSEECCGKFLSKGDKPLSAICYQAESLSAYKLVIGKLKLGLEKGLNLQTDTPSTSLYKGFE